MEAICHDKESPVSILWILDEQFQSYGQICFCQSLEFYCNMKLHCNPSHGSVNCITMNCLYTLCNKHLIHREQLNTLVDHHQVCHCMLLKKCSRLLPNLWNGHYYKPKAIFSYTQYFSHYISFTLAIKTLGKNCINMGDPWYTTYNYIYSFKYQYIQHKMWFFL